ncbi:epidermal growth factor-like protein 7 isoform X2 [Zootermopsis nevadensis]|uniref:epidermal growth factor-like protein 7 isoform X2 n=1 Tax=Zootermopsis nevadensis TaxID=136037 RepID=UPI000B8E5DB7|nr:epidermal growth factor-like protein 7 isoform X2 [Zootermopsis nevadensis]
MLWRLAVLWLVVSIATCLRSSSSSGHQRDSSYVARAADSELIIDNNRDKSYASFTKLHAGRHVCSVQKAVTQPVKILQSYCKPAFKSYTQPCLDNKSCNGVRLVYETAFRTVYETKINRYTSYICCPGWTQITKIDNGCNKALCRRLCLNGGSCIKPDMCVCLPGFTGKLCESDIDECREKPCDHTCINVNGSFYCQCHDGFDLQGDGRSCRSHEGKDATEARDLLDYDILAKKVQKLEKVMVRHSSDPATDEAISELKGKVKLIIENIAELRHQLNDIERHQNEYHQQMESLQPYRVEIQRINTLCDQVAGIKQTLNECNCRSYYSNRLVP